RQLVAGHHPGPEREARDQPGRRPRGDHDVLRLDDLLFAVAAGDGHLARARQPPMSVQALDLVLAEEEFDSLAGLVGDVFAELPHAVHVDLDAAGVDADALAVFRLVVNIGAVEHRLGGDAPPQRASAADAGILLDDHGLEAILARADGADVAAGPAA